MPKIVLFLAVIGACIGCSGSQVQETGSSAPGHEIVSEQEENTLNLKTKTIKVSTDSIKEKELRQISEEIKSENADQDVLNIEFYAPGQSEGQDDPLITGSATVVNNEEAAEQLDEAVNQVLGGPLSTDSDKENLSYEKLLNEKNGIDVIAFAQIQQDMKQDMRELEKEMDQDMREMEQDMEQDMPKMPELPKPSKP